MPAATLQIVNTSEEVGREWELVFQFVTSFLCVRVQGQGKTNALINSQHGQMRWVAQLRMCANIQW